MADFTVDENGVAYDNRQESPQDLPKTGSESEFKGSGWWVAIVWLLFLVLILAAVVANRPILTLENCSGPDCAVVPTIFLIVGCVLSGIFIFKPALAYDEKGLRYLTSAILFILLVDFGHAGILNAWHGDRHYLVATLDKISRRVLRTSEPSNSILFSFVYLLSPLPFFIPDVMRAFRKLRSRRRSQLLPFQN